MSVLNNNKVIAFLDQPSNLLARTFSSLLLVLIYLTVTQVVIQEKLPEFFSTYAVYFNALEYFALFVFSVEYIARIMFSNNRLKYILSLYGVIDALAIFPGLLGIFVTNIPNTLWLRVIKIFRLVRILKFSRMSHVTGGILGQLLPFLGVAIAFKGVTLILESQTWWPEIMNLNIIVGVVGFALAVLLGTKLSVVNSRIYAIEDAVCRIVGGLRDMQNQGDIKKDLLVWSKNLEKALKSSKETKGEMVKAMREQTDTLEEKLEAAGIGGPNTASFHRDVAYLLHRATAKTPQAYNNFLKNVTVVYTLVVIFSVPGLTGFIVSALIVYVLGGMYFIIDDMDDPLSYGENSFIDVRLDALEFYNGSSNNAY